jgi:hypothetical protein
MRAPGIIHADSITSNRTTVQREERPGVWVAARPEPYHSITQRWRAAWLVWTGKADALLWRDQ